MQTATRTRQLAAATTHQSSQEVVMTRIIATRHLFVLIQSRLRQIEGFLTDDRWHSNGDPLLGWCGLLALAWPDRLERRFPAPRRGWVTAATVGLPNIGLRAQDSADTGNIPARLTSRGWDAIITQPLGHHI